MKHCLTILTLISSAFLANTLFAQQTNWEQKLNDLLPNSRSESYRKIAWETDLLKARERSKKTGIPLFLWVMDGHPLGCT